MVMAPPGSPPTMERQSFVKKTNTLQVPFPEKYADATQDADGYEKRGLDSSVHARTNISMRISGRDPPKMNSSSQEVDLGANEPVITTRRSSRPRKRSSDTTSLHEEPDGLSSSLHGRPKTSGKMSRRASFPASMTTYAPQAQGLSASGHPQRRSSDPTKQRVNEDETRGTDSSHHQIRKTLGKMSRRSSFPASMIHALEKTPSSSSVPSKRRSSDPKKQLEDEQRGTDSSLHQSPKSSGKMPRRGSLSSIMHLMGDTLNSSLGHSKKRRSSGTKNQRVETEQNVTSRRASVPPAEHDSSQEEEPPRPRRKKTQDGSLGWEDVEVHELLGIGTFNQVHAMSFSEQTRSKSVDHRPQNRTNAYALKCIQHEDLEMYKSSSSIDEVKEDLVKEGRVLSRLRGHPNIIHLHCLSREANGCVETAIKGRFLVLERLSGTVEESLRRWKLSGISQRTLGMRIPTRGEIKFRESQSRYRQELIAVPLASALDYLHSHQIVFRDLKPSNIGYDQNENVKLFDFGLARELPRKEYGEDYTLTQNTGSPRYMSPECYKGTDYGLATDVYSFGLILWELGTLKKPYNDMKMSNLVKRVYHGNTRPKLNYKCGPERIRQLIKSCWDENTYARPSVSEIREILDEALLSDNESPTPAQRRLGFCRRTTM